LRVTVTSHVVVGQSFFAISMLNSGSTMATVVPPQLPPEAVAVKVTELPDVLALRVATQSAFRRPARSMTNRPSVAAVAMVFTSKLRRVGRGRRVSIVTGRRRGRAREAVSWKDVGTNIGVSLHPATLIW
jgi:hypothetical protein